MLVKFINMLYEAAGEEEFARLFGLESRAGMLSLIGEGYKTYQVESWRHQEMLLMLTLSAFEEDGIETITIPDGLLLVKSIKQVFTNMATIAIPMVC